MLLLQTLKEAKNVRCSGEGIYRGFRLRGFKRERAFLSRNTGDPTVGSLRDKKENCSTQRGLRVDTGFVSF